MRCKTHHTHQHADLALTHLSCSDKLMIVVCASPSISATVNLLRILGQPDIIPGFSLNWCQKEKSFLFLFKDIEGESYLFSVGGTTVDMSCMEIIHRAFAYPQMSTGQGHTQAALQHAHQHWCCTKTLPQCRNVFVLSPDI